MATGINFLSPYFPLIKNKDILLIQQKTGNLLSLFTNKNIDWLNLEWHETNKRILHKKTRTGIEVTLKFLKENPHLTQGDILYEDTETIIAVDIQSCDAIVIKPKNNFEIAAICYEIGNKHLPLFFHDDELLIAFENPLFNLLTSLEYDVKKETRKLLNPLKTSVASHAHNNSESLFSRILKVSNYQP
ncbi:MAG: urease accessory protein UreE [Ginsengibacter sp.]